MRLQHPLPGARITQRFGEHPEAYAAFGLNGHEGLDFSTQIGTPVRAAHAGRVTRAVDENGYGLYVAITTDTMRTVYAHLSEAQVAGDSQVVAGQIIGLSGSSGNSTGPHLHFGVCPLPRDWDNGYEGYVDPGPYLVEEENVMTRSKLSVHFQNNPELGTEATELVRNSNMRWVKGIDVDKWPTPAGEMFPGKKVLGRFCETSNPDVWDAQFVTQGAAGADAYCNAHASRIARFKEGGGWAIEGPNGFHSFSPNAIATEAAFWIRLIENARARWDLPVAWGSTSNGWFLFKGKDWTYAEHQVVYYRDVFKAQLDYGGYWSKQEYGAPSVLDGDGYWTLGYRKQFDALGFTVPTIIGECGIAWAAIPGNADTGWRSHSGYVYPAQYGLPQGVMNRERYWRQLSAYDDELCKDDYVVSAHIFGLCPTPDWESFSYGDWLIRRMAEKHGSATEPPVEPLPTMPTDEQIRNAAWNAVGVPYNPSAAFPAYARAHGLGAPLAGESDLGNVRLQPFMGGIVCCEISDWANVRTVPW